MSDPLVSVLVLNLNGRRHLEGCLPSLQAQDYPRDRFEILVVDNASTDDSVQFTQQRFPDVGIIRHAANLGFAGAYAAAIPKARGTQLAFLNNDTRVDPSWLSQMVQTGRDHGAAAVASTMLAWDGSTVDFCGGVVSLMGHAWQLGHGEPAASRPTTPRPLLFACGGAMLVDRAAYEEAGGFDPGYFAYFEDVDLGWRMSLLGRSTVLAPGAIAYHRVHGTAGRYAYAQRLRLYERNALRTIYKCLGREWLGRVLPVAIALTLERGLRDAGPTAEQFAIGSKPPDVLPVSRRAVATLLALEDFAGHLNELDEKRRVVQAQRVVSDESLLPLFGEPLRLHDLGPAYEGLARELFAEFGLDRLVEPDAARLKPRPTYGTVRADVRGAELQPGRDDDHPAVRRAGLQPGHDDSGTTPPRVSVIILTALGPTHLPDCLDSLAGLRYPPDLLDVIIVDNGSAVDPEPAVREHYPAARLVRLERNVGFCRGNAAGADVATGEWLAFLNDDTRVDPDWLDEMLATAAARSSPCVGARILDWHGERLDFGGAAFNFEGKGFQVGYASRNLDRWSDEQPILFACGAAMLVRRALFQETGGFDEALFAYYEDLAFGWQLWMRGHDVWLSPRAIVYHRHHGTSGKWMEAPRIRLYERNALRNVFIGLERGHLGRVLSASLLLSVARTLHSAGLSAGEPDRDGPSGSALRSLRWRLQPGVLWQHARTVLISRGAGRAAGIGGSLRRLGIRGLGHTLVSTLRFVLRGRQITRAGRAAYAIEQGTQGRDLDESLDFLGAEAAAGLVALAEWLDSLPEQRRRRAELQDSRRRTDRDILSRFGSHWTRPVILPDGAGYARLHEIIVAALDVAAIKDEPTPDDASTSRP